MTEPLTQDAVLAQLRTRGFEEGFQRTPLRDFWGDITDFGGEMRDGQRGPYLVVFYNFNNIEVLPGGSTEPYNSPIGQIEVPHSNRGKSKFGYLGKSIDAIVNAGVGPDVLQEQAKNQDYLIGKRCHMKLTPGHMIWNQDAGEERPVDCWELIEIAGESAAPVSVPAVAGATPPVAVAPPATAPPATGLSSSQQALALLDGKNEQQWHQVVFIDPIVKADPAVVNAIISRTFLTPMETAGIVTKDATGIYHVKREG